MDVHCPSAVRLFLHTFLLINNGSMPPSSVQAATEVQMDPLHNASEELLLAVNDTGLPHRVGHLRGVLECMQMYMLPVLITLGVGGSALGMAVLLGTQMRFKFLSHFLVCLNVSSAAFLLNVFIQWLHDNGLQVFSAPGLCQVHVFSSHFFTFLTVWHSVLGAYLVLLDWLRPGAVPWLHSPTVAKTTVVGLSVLAFTIYSYKTWTHFSLVRRGVRTCTVIPENEAAMEMLNVLDVLLLLVLPSLLYAVFVLLVLAARVTSCCPWARGRVGCCVRGRERVVYTCHAGGLVAELDLAVSGCPPPPRCREVHRLVLSQAACFLLLVTPRTLSTLVVIVQRWVMQRVQTSDDILLHQVFQFSYYLYFAVLPFCPAFTSSKFRLHCCSLFTSFRRRRARPANKMTPV